MWDNDNIYRSDVTFTQSKAAAREVNETLLEYFNPYQLLLFRAGIVFAFISPALRGNIVLINLKSINIV